MEIYDHVADIKCFGSLDEEGEKLEEEESPFIDGEGTHFACSSQLA